MKFLGKRRDTGNYVPSVRQIAKNLAFTEILAALDKFVSTLESGKELSLQNRFMVWDNYSKKLEVHIDFDGTATSSLWIGLLSDLVQQASCSCGTEGLLARYVFQEINHTTALEAVFECPKCSKKSLVGKFQAIWGQTTKLEISPFYIRYEKKGD